MNIQTIVKVISAVFGLLGVVFLFRIIGVGDEESILASDPQLMLTMLILTQITVNGMLALADLG